jgi:hypothetical protein
MAADGSLGVLIKKYHESTKLPKHERKKIRVFQFSCFRDESFLIPACAG